MRRRIRDEAPGAIHHAVPKGNGGGRIVEDDHDRRALLSRLRHVSETHGWLCHTYCVMDTHVHAVIETPQPNLGKGMHALLGWYAFRYNDRHGRSGHLFGGPYWSRRVADTEHFVAAVPLRRPQPRRGRALRASVRVAVVQLPSNRGAGAGVVRSLRPAAVRVR